jgi:hypothetical protein
MPDFLEMTMTKTKAETTLGELKGSIRARDLLSILAHAQGYKLGFVAVRYEGDDPVHLMVADPLPGKRPTRRQAELFARYFRGAWEALALAGLCDRP